MTPEAQRIAIAQACGWTRIEIVLVDLGGIVEVAFGKDPLDKLGGMSRGLPDYLNDLNAMYEAEKSLVAHCNDDDREDVGNVQRYENELVAVLRDTDPFMGASFGDLWHASAAQRAEAFIRCLDLWKEERA